MMKKRILLNVVALLACSTVASAQVAFTKGNIVVHRYGDGTAKTAGTLQATFLDEYKPDGTFVRSIAMPTTTVGNQRALTAINNSPDEGILTRSVDGAYLSFLGWEAALGATTTAGSPHVIGRVSAAGEVNTATAFPIKTHTKTTGVYSIDGSSFYIAGARTKPNSGIQLIDFELNKGKAGATAETNFDMGTGLAGASTSTFPYIFNNRLYYSNGSAMRAYVGELPLPDPLPGYANIATFEGGDPASSQFVFFDTNADNSPDVMYLANTSSATIGHLMKYVLDSETADKWVNKGAISLAGKTNNTKFLTASLSAGVVTIYFTTIGDASSTPDATPSALYKITNNITTDLKNADLPATPLVTAPANTTFRGVAFAPFVDPTPVKLSSFTGKMLNTGSVQLNWTTVSETNNSYFEVLRSINGDQQSVIGTVKGNNNSHSVINYSFTDYNPASGSNYYQLNQVDNDGVSEKSPLISVNGSMAKPLLSGKFVGSSLDVTVTVPDAQKGKLYLTDTSGRIILDQNVVLVAGLNQLSFVASSAASGVYVLTLVSNGERTKVKLVK